MNKIIFTKEFRLLFTFFLLSATAKTQTTSSIKEDKIHEKISSAETQRYQQKNDSIRRWLAGDHHIHSHYSAAYDTSTDPPTPRFNEQPYSIPTNATKAKQYGLSWMVSTDHGGPNHSKINLEHAYPELLESRRKFPDLIQFHGMEFDAPAAGHASLIIPHSNHEHQTLFDIESRFAKRDQFPETPERDTEERMLEALNYMKDIVTPPVLIANHPSRGAEALGTYSQKEPQELRNWNNTAPNVAIGMEGAPGHQAGNIQRDGSIDSTASRPYENQTRGGYDQMTSQLGGFWDSMLGEGRRWWITATSDSHTNWRDGGSDFWPGEYSKTYVFAKKDYEDILEGIRNGRVFVTTGDLISELEVTAGAKNREATIGGALQISGNTDVTVTIRVRVPEEPNANGDNPKVARIDLVLGEITGTLDDLTKDFNLTTHVAKRFYPSDWIKDGNYLLMRYLLKDVHHSSYIRVRGTNTNEIEPEKDHQGEDPWSDLWFYSNPIFIEVK